MRDLWLVCAIFIPVINGFVVDRNGLESLVRCEQNFLAVRASLSRGNSILRFTDNNCTDHNYAEVEPDPTLNSLRQQIQLYSMKTVKDEPIKDTLNLGSTFNCFTSPSKSIPTSVHQLKPGDIKIVAALGDSLTAANGGSGETLADVSKEYRGIAFSIGDDETLETVTTLPNILQMFNPTVVGASNNVGPVWYKPVSQFNVAVPGSKAVNLTSQAKELINRLKQDSRLNYNDDWKLITMFIGANDLCAYCKDNAMYSTDKWIRYTQDAIDLLKLSVPRALISIVNNVDVTKLRKLHVYSYCRLIRRFECPCIVEDSDASEVTLKSDQYQQAVHKLVNSGRYDTDDQFTVVVQQFIEGVQVPMLDQTTPDVSFFAPDCFHFGEKAHAAAARALWTDMLNPVGGKMKFLDIANQSSQLPCPKKECPYIRTWKNSADCTVTKPLIRNRWILAKSTSDNTDPAAFLNPVLIAGIVLVSVFFLIALVFLGKFFVKRHTISVTERSPLLSKIF